MTNVLLGLLTSAPAIQMLACTDGNFTEGVFTRIYTPPDAVALFCSLCAPSDIPVMGGGWSIFTWEHFMGQSELVNLSALPASDL